MKQVAHVTRLPSSLSSPEKRSTVGIMRAVVSSKPLSLTQYCTPLLMCREIGKLVFYSLEVCPA